MKNLYKKIYEAINTGIQKALVLDDENDISMNYQYKKIINNKNLLPYYVDELLNNIDDEYNYEQIIKYYEETGYTYKVKNFNELKDIFDKIKDIEGASFKWISNMKDYISIVLDDKSEINFYEESNKKPLFLKFANDDILGTENEILIYLDDEHYIPKKEYSWQSKEVQIQDDEYIINMEKYGSLDKAIEIAEKDYSGYETCLRIHDIVSKNPKKYGKIPAIDYCLSQNVNSYQGYLPSMGQLRIMSDNLDMINYIFKYLNLKEIKDLNKVYWWSSTEYNINYSWNLYYCSPNYYYYYNFKVGNYNRIFPLFAVKKN
ncbi:MAG: hypothetical protein [Wendovervirus sonii]|uniref:DUF1566 domain-containing protein n=1 Tax=phage Lak_Megaphage_Sonny TaxID=3109229 RepID=A0ABZ0Z638_9CAUD|nr:MAG: hypothetical protein [phage Lak_Megaphage_Sonny]